MTTHRYLLWSALALATPAIAQTTAAKAEPLVCIRGFEREVLDAAAAMFAEQPHHWQRSAGTQGEVRVDADGSLTMQETAATLPASTVVQMSVRLRAWMEHSSATVAQLEKTWAPRLMLLGTSLGLPRELARELEPSLRAVLQDIEQCEVTLARTTPAGAELALAITPATGSATHAWLQHLRPGGRGGIALETPAAFAHMTMDLQGDSLALACAPFAPWIASLTAGTGPEALADQTATLRCLNGLGALTIDAEGLRLALGLRDAKGYADAAFAKSTLARQQEHLAKQRIDMEYTVGALSHREIPVMKSAALPATPTPWLAAVNGEVFGYLAVTERFALSTAGGSHGEATIRALIDAALDQKLAPAVASTTSNAPLARAQIDLLRLEGTVPEAMRTRMQGEKLAGVLQVELHANPSTLTIKAQIR